MNILVVHEVSYEKKVVYEYQEFAERLSSLGHRVFVIDFDEHGDSKYKKSSLTRTGYGKIELENTPFFNFPILKYFSGRINYKKLLRKKLNDTKIDVVFLYSIFINGTNTIRICKKFNIPVIYRVLDVYHKIRRNIFMFLPLLIGEKYIYRNADIICVTNNKMVSYVEKMAKRKLACEPVVLQHGVDTTLFTKRKKDKSLAEKYSISEDDKVALFIGTTYNFSGLDVIIDKFKNLEAICPHTKIIIVGGGELDSKLKMLVRKNNLKKRVLLTGMQPYSEIPRFISLADVTFNSFFINNITRDIVPIKILQYLACGKPVICSPLPDVKKIFPEVESGVLYSDISKPNTFISLIGNTLLDIELQKELAKNAVRFIEQNFSLNSQVEKLEKLLISTTHKE